MKNKERIELAERVKNRIESLKPFNVLVKRGKEIDKEVNK